MKKAAEECSELATILIQQLNKPNKDFTARIIEEIGDVLFRLENLKRHYDTQEIKKRILFKKEKNKK